MCRLMETAAWIKRHPLLALSMAVVLTLGGWFGGNYALAAYHWRSAQRYLGERRFNEAQAQVALCLEAWPDRGDVHLLAARIARLRRDAEEAWRQLESARKLGGNIERVVLEGYLLDAEHGGLEAVEKKLLAFLRKDDADSVYILDVLTYPPMLARQFSEGLSRLDAWLALAPRDPEPHVRRAWVRERLRDAPGALAEYQKALDLDPERDRYLGDRVRLRYAELLLEHLRLPEASAQFELLLKYQPQKAEVIFGLARCRLALGETEEGSRLLENLLTQHPDHGRAWSELARAHLAQERLAEAEADFRRALALLPRDRSTVFGMQQCLERLGKRNEARQMQERLDRVVADEKQMAKLMTALQRSPNDPSLHQRIGEIFLRNGMVEEGLLRLQAALLCDKSYLPAHEVLAEWWESQGAADKAAPHRQVLERQGVTKRANRFEEKN